MAEYPQQTFVLSDGTDLTPLFNYLTGENGKLRVETMDPEEIAEEEQDEFILAHMDLLPSEFAEQVKSLLLPALSLNPEPDQPEVLPSTYLYDEPDSSENIEYSETGEIKAVSLTKLVERVTDMSSSGLSQVLLATYPLYTTADALLEMILHRLQVPIPVMMSASERSLFVEQKLKTTHTLITSVLKQWIKMWPDSFRVGSHLFTQLGEFFPANREFSVEANSRILAKQLSKVQEECSTANVFAEDRVPPQPLLPKELDFKSNPLLVWPAEELARQLTLIDFKHLKKVQITECLGRRWVQDGEAPNVAKLVQRFASRRAQFISAIVNESELEARVRIATKLLEIAACCLDHFSNYESPFIIRGVFVSTAVISLKTTLREVSKKATANSTYNRLISLYEACDFSTIKPLMEKQCVVPCWVAMRDELYKIDIAANYTASGLININKHEKTAKVILKLREYQSKDVCFHKVALCYNYLKAKNFVFDERECERRAKLLEK